MKIVFRVLFFLLIALRFPETAGRELEDTSGDAVSQLPRL